MRLVAAEFAVVLFLSVCLSPAQTQDQIERKVSNILRKMTIEEKIGQMTQVTLSVVSKGTGGAQEPHDLDSEKLRTALVKYRVGSIFNVVSSAFTVDHWHQIVSTIQNVATKETRLGIPVLYGIDAIHGATYTQGSTLFPQSFAVAATWNPEIANKIGVITARETRASGIPWNFHPVLDLGRQPLWPRFWETYGEDVFLASRMGAAYIRGLQGASLASGGVAACIKHYAGYSFPLSGKDRTPAWIDERMMREYFLPTFEAGVRAGAMSVMVNSGEVNGIPTHANRRLLTEILKGEWNFRGFVVSDWEDIKRLHTRDKVADTPKEAVRMAVMAGVDMSMVPFDFSFAELLLQLVKEKSVPVSRIDDAVRRILWVKFMLGLFDRPFPDAARTTDFASVQSTAFNEEAAVEAITLLKNEQQILPLKKGTRVLVTGPGANLLSSLNGGWTITWQGNDEAVYPKEKKTILEAIEEINGKEHVAYVPGASFKEAIDIPAAALAAESADVVIACLGEEAYCETPGNINDLTLDEAQLRLVEEISKSGKPVILVLTEGRPRIIRRIADHCKATLMGYLPGMEGGTAIAKVLFGEVNPSGKLPFSYPKYTNSIVPYDCKVTEVVDGNMYDPEFAFGFGLSYTTFGYRDLALNRKTYSMRDAIEVSVTVENTGKREGKESVQVYLSDLYRSVTPPVRQLKGFEKISLSPGQQSRVRFRLTSAELSFIGRENKRITEPGTFRVTVDTLAAEFELRRK